jgi:hypothetical protein
MAAGSKSGIGTAFVMVGLALVMLGLVFLIAGKFPVGITNIGSGVVFIAVGVAAARKAASPDDNTRAP